MKRSIKKLSVGILIAIVILVISKNVFGADDISNIFSEFKYSEKFENYLKLPEEERKKVLVPRTYDIPKTSVTIRNPIKMVRALEANTETRFSLKDVIPNNVVVRNQGKLQTCWTFSSIGALETNLALTYNKNKTYDFSEKHMNYSTTRFFKNNEENKYGWNRDAEGEGSWNAAIGYLTNGMGAINEAQMPYDDSAEKIYISEIQNKNVTSQIYDTIDFPTYETSEVTAEFKKAIKAHIKQYGGIEAAIHGAQLGGDYCNIRTGAIYCDNAENCPINHGVLIIGWDDEYAIDNFNTNHKPKNKGAWIIKNSWGEKTVACEDVNQALQEIKEVILEKYPEECANNNWKNASQIPDEIDTAFITERLGWVIEDGKVYLPIGDNGIMYVSYEDINIYTELHGIIKSTDKTDYENRYQYNELGMVCAIPFLQTDIYLGNVFEKKTSGTEYLTGVALNLSETNTCKVFVNLNGTSLEKSKLQQVQLKAGETETLEAGYHTLEFLEPVEILGNSFAIVVENKGTRTNINSFGVECNLGGVTSTVKTEKSKCFFTFGEYFDANDWIDLSELPSIDSSYPASDTTIKAFTVSEITDHTLKNIKVTTPPTKTTYIEGENFDKKGMSITANYNDGTSEVVTNYEIKDGKNLKKTQKSITISYEGKTTTQAITVKEKVEQTTPEEGKPIKEIKIVKMPTKIKYTQNKEELDLTGGTIIVNYSDGSTSKEIPMTSSEITVTGFSNTKVGKVELTLKYKQKTVKFNVEIVEDTSPKSSNLEKAKTKINSVKLYTYTDKSKKNYATIKLEVNNISKAAGNDSYEYYYYLSPNQKETNIKNWIKINKGQINNGKLSITIDIDNIEDYNDLANSDTLYLYIKEEVTKGAKQATIVSKGLAFALDDNSKIETYVNDKKAEQNNKGTSNTNSEDNTVAGGTIPQAGGKVAIFIVIGAIIFIGIVSIIKTRSDKFKDI